MNIKICGKTVMMIFVVATFLFAPFETGHTEESLEVITLHYRSSDEIIPVLKPLIFANGSISGLQNQLIIRTTARNLAEIKRILAAIDRAPRNLLITVRQNANVDDAIRSGEVSGTISAGKQTKATIVDTKKNNDASVGIKSGESEVKARLLSTDSVDSDKSMQKIRTLEGHSTFVRFGKSIPTPQRMIVQQGSRVNIVDSVEYRDVITGFQVIPRLNGDQVTLDIAPQRDTVGATGNVSLQSLHTILSGRLGEWIDAGGIVNDDTSRSTTIGSRSVKTRGNQRTVLIKVDEVN